MKLRLAINGFGRIGRLTLRAALETKRDDLEFVAVNVPGFHRDECSSAGV